MKISEFLKDKTLEIIFAIFLIITIIAFLSVTQVDLFIKMYIPIAILLFFIIVLTVEYIKKKKFYNAVKESLIELDEKYLIAETIENPSFLDGKLLKNILIETDKSMIEHVNKYKYLQEEYKENLRIVSSSITFLYSSLDHHPNQILTQFFHYKYHLCICFFSIFFFIS